MAGTARRRFRDLRPPLPTPASGLAPAAIRACCMDCLHSSLTLPSRSAPLWCPPAVACSANFDPSNSYDNCFCFIGMDLPRDAIPIYAGFYVSQGLVKSIDNGQHV